MYSNIGRKIKVLSQVVGLLSMIVGIVVWIYFITNFYTEYGRYGDYRRYLTSDDWIGWFSLVAGVLGIIVSWPLYGFGELIESVGEIAINSVKPTASIFCSDNTDKPAKSVFKSVNNVEPTAETYSSAFTENQNKIPAWKRVEMEKQNQDNQ